MKTKSAGLSSQTKLSETQILQLQLLLRDQELLNLRSQVLLAEFRTTLQPEPEETVFDATILRFRAPTIP